MKSRQSTPVTQQSPSPAPTVSRPTPTRPRPGGMSRPAIAGNPLASGRPLPHLADTQAHTGRRLDEPILAQMEQAFASDFSSVRLHFGSVARQLGAGAITAGEHIHFDPQRFSPGSAATMQLLGHELAHVIQQRQARVPTQQVWGDLPVNRDSGLEQEAERAGVLAARGLPTGVLLGHGLGHASRPVLQGGFWDYMGDKWQATKDYYSGNPQPAHGEPTSDLRSTSTVMGAVDGFLGGGTMTLDATKEAYNRTQGVLPGHAGTALGGLAGAAAFLGTSALPLLGAAGGAVLNSAKGLKALGVMIPEMWDSHQDSEKFAEDDLRDGDSWWRAIAPTRIAKVLEPSTLGLYNYLKNVYLGREPDRPGGPRPGIYSHLATHNINAPHAGHQLAAGWGSLQAGLGSVPLGLLLGAGKSTYRLNELTKDLIAPGPIASPTGPFSLPAVLTSAPDTLEIKNKSLTNWLGFLGRGAATADLVGALAQGSSGAFHSIKGLVSWLRDYSEGDRTGRATSWSEFTGGARDLTLGTLFSLAEISKGKEGGYLAAAIYPDKAWKLSPALGYVSQSAYLTHHLYRAGRAGLALELLRRSQIPAPRSALEDLENPQAGPGLNPNQKFVREATDYAKTKKWRGLMRNLLAAGSAGLTIAGTAVGLTTGAGLALAGGGALLGLGLGVQKLLHYLPARSKEERSRYATIISRLVSQGDREAERLARAILPFDSDAIHDTAQSIGEQSLRDQANLTALLEEGLSSG